MLKFEIIVTEEEIVVSEEGEAILLHQAREALEAQALSGKDRDGNTIKGKSGKTLDLHGSTGKLWNNVTEAPAEGGLIFTEPYAEEVLTKYKADGLNAASMEALEETLTAPMNQHVTNKEVK